MNTANKNNLYKEAYDLVANINAELVYNQSGNLPESIAKIEFVLTAPTLFGTPKVLARGDLGVIADELSKAWSDDWLHHFENGGYDSTIGQWLDKYDARLRIIKPRRKQP